MFVLIFLTKILGNKCVMYFDLVANTFSHLFLRSVRVSEAKSLIDSTKFYWFQLYLYFSCKLEQTQGI